MHPLPRYNIGIRVIDHAGAVDRVVYPRRISGHIGIRVLILGISQVTTDSFWSNGSDISRPNSTTEGVETLPQLGVDLSYWESVEVAIHNLVVITTAKSRSKEAQEHLQWLHVVLRQGAKVPVW